MKPRSVREARPYPALRQLSHGSLRPPSWVPASRLSTVVNVALPVLQTTFHATVVDVQWVVESYGLFLSALILAGGALGDLFGRRRVFLIGVGIFAVASAACGLASSVLQLIIARSVQGVGAALLVPGSLAIISAAFLTSFIFSLGGFINALFAKNFDQISWFPTFVLTPLTYLGGVFYSVSMLPIWAHVASNANPILYMVSAFRFGFLGTSDVDLGLAYAIMISAAAVMFALAVTLLNRGTGIRE